MDTLTHGIAGALVGKAFLSERQGRIATIAVTLGAVFPDSDFFANLFNRNDLAMLENHRGITHSFVALPLFALLLGGLTCLLARQRKWLLFPCFYGIGIAVHIVLDLITSFGTMIWSPVSNARVAWDMTFIIDLVLTTIVLLPQLVAWMYSDRHRAWRRGSVTWLCLSIAGVAVAWLAASVQVPLSGWVVVAGSALLGTLLLMPSLGHRGFQWRRSTYCRVGVAGLVIYLGLCQLAHQAALARVEEFVKHKGVAAQRLAALPSPPSLFRWSGLVETPTGIYRVSIDLGDSSEPADRFFANAGSNRYLQTAEGLPGVQSYLRFARFPWVTYRQDNGIHVIEYNDIQFLRGPQGNNSPFTYQVSLDSEGRVLSSGLLEP